ncbi:MAG: ferrous iron transport protein B [Candidatus Latescibacteria bacterium]|nr:ferrous iron transport protein B [Candidatus Latescibacterota bacterium]NIM22116.1 ferrous iron transport protein B [Candidatus Latescibacterota bacterium]NIM64666.1 ferrous iron transport protein B [Candidatus Latescibacterota bacterium]NIO01176.1 ferrous iron transport protein B [Candidatus Latescibacterota bacterium]NIO27561.1 ferrous iron transport protein B [Candidatus Latescibacterota bacterium]
MHQDAATAPKTHDKPIILVGNPNVGKSVIFAHLTGRYAIVSNYPGTTVEVSTGKSIVDGRTRIVDTPGANSLHPQSEDERVTRDILCSTSPRAVLQIADAKNLRRSLTLTAQIAEMGLPAILDLNMMDEARRRRIAVSGSSLQNMIRIPVVETVATEKKGFRLLEKAISEPASVPQISVTYPEEIENGIRRISKILPEMPIEKRAVALMFLSNPREATRAFGGQIGVENAERIRGIAAEIQGAFANPLGYIIGVSRSKVVDQLLDAVYRKDTGDVSEEMHRAKRKRAVFFSAGIALFSIVMYAWIGVETLSSWGMHPTLLHLIGISVLLAVTPSRFFGTITTHPFWGSLFLIEVLYLVYKFVGVFGAGALVDLFENRLFGAHLLPWISGLLNRAVPFAIANDLLIGQYGLISMGLTYAIAIVLPIVAMFFFIFGILEDTGYLPRLAVVADKGMKRIGLNGKAVLPMVLGLGCDTMATLTTRILDTRKERIIATLLLALGIPCSAQLGVILAMVAGSSVAVAFTVFIVIVSQLVIVGSLSARVVKGRRGDFIVELPPLRVPQLSNIFIKTNHRIRWYLFEAVPLFLIGTLILFVLDRIGGLLLLQSIAEPVIVRMLGLPIESTVAFILGFFRRDYGAAGLYDLFQNGYLNHNQIAVSMVTITLFVPCIAHFLVMIKERGLKISTLIVAFIVPYAILVGTLLNFFLRLTGIGL